MLKSRVETWAALIVGAVGVVIAAVVGLLAYLSATAPLHSNPQDVPSVTRAAPAPRWAGAVEQGRQAARSGLLDQNLPGLSVAVGAGGGIVWAEGFGWADLENRVPVSPETKFRIGTASAALTSAAVGLLLEKGGLNLDDERTKYVPAYPETQQPVTLRQLMAHVAGVPDDGGDEGPLFTERCARPADAFQYLNGYERQLRFEPGTAYSYSSYGWILVSAAVEAAGDAPFLAFMRKHVFDPVGMDHTGADSATEPMPDRARSYFPRFAADPNYGQHPMRDLEYSCYAGASGLVSTPSDLVRFGLAINSGTLLQPATVKVLQTSQRLASGAETGYGLGWDLETVAVLGRQTRTVGHDGEILGGMVASLVTFPERGIVVAVTSNISYADTFAIAVNVAQAFVQPAASAPK